MFFNNEATENHLQVHVWLTFVILFTFKKKDVECHIAQASLELTIYPKVTLNFHSPPSRLYFSSLCLLNSIYTDNINLAEMKGK